MTTKFRVVAIHIDGHSRFPRERFVGIREIREYLADGWAVYLDRRDKTVELSSHSWWDEFEAGLFRRRVI